MSNQEVYAAIGREMVVQDNRLTMAPIWWVDKDWYTTAKGAAQRHPHQLTKITTAAGNAEILEWMRICLEAAGYTAESPEVYNAYSVCFK